MDATPFFIARRPGMPPGRGPFLALAGLPRIEAEPALRKALAPELIESGDFAGDWDDCSLDGKPIRDSRSWHDLLAAGRLANVIGAFAITAREPGGAVYLARDPVGERTLFYAQTPEFLLAASSPRLVVATGLIDRELDLHAVAAYLAYAYVPGAGTLFANVRELLPGEMLTWRRGRGGRSEPFWRLPAEAEETTSEPALRDELRHLLESAIRRRLPGPDEPVAATLSGGIDSSLVVALLRRLHPAPVHTFSISFGPGYANELPHSSLVAQHCATSHHILEIPPDTVLAHFDETMALLAEPIGDPLTVPNLLLFRAAAPCAGAVFNGEGGDPSFGGPKNQPMLLSELFGGGAPVEGGRARDYLRAHGKCFDDFDAMLAPELADAVRTHPLEEDLRPWMDDPRWPHYIARLQAINVSFKGAHHTLPKVHALAGGGGVLPKSPLFDQRIVEFALRAPAPLKVHGAVEKYLLKEAVRDLLPPQIVDRPKSGMLVPVEKWFEGPMRAEAKRRLLDGLSPLGLIRRDYLERLLDRKLPGLRPRIGAKIWLLLTLESWLRA